MSTASTIRKYWGVLAFDRQGAGPSMVLVHGITDSRRAWDPLLPALAASHDVVAVDLRGHGESAKTPPYDMLTMAGDVHEVVDAAGVSAPLLVGHSLGGAVVTAYAAMFGCRGVVNVDQPLALGGFQEVLRSIESQLRGDNETFQLTIAAFANEMRGQLSGEEWRRLESLRHADQEVVLGVWSPVLEMPLSELDALETGMVATVSVPYLALHGSEPGADYAEWLRGLIPTAEVEVWDGLGHYLHLVDPKRFVERVAAFDASLAGRYDS